MCTSVFVISDLHLGGREGFQMCTRAGRERLGEFIRYLATQKRDNRDVQLVINGDSVEFLSQPDEAGRYSGFVADQAQAVKKLEAILSSTAEVWLALRALTAAGCGLVILSGNHDIELSLPAVRQRFQQELGRGRVELVYDNQALAMGELLIEHGNRYDAWNVVPHATLRRIRSCLSRREAPPDYPVQPGSRLVVDVMNPIKARYPWVDLLKPEGAGLLKLLNALGAIGARDVLHGLHDAVAMARRWMQFDLDGLPTDDEYVRAVAGRISEPDDPDEELVSAKRTADPDAEDLAELGRQRVDSDLHPSELLDAFRRRAKKDGTTFNVDREADTYRRPANRLAETGYRVVVFGHTHLPKVVQLDGGAVYLNTGTWADLMRVPESAYSERDDGKALADIEKFVKALSANDIGRFRRQLPTYARVDLSPEGKILDKGLFLFDGPNRAAVPVSTAEVLARLDGGE